MLPHDSRSACEPSGLSGPGGTLAGSSGFSRRIDTGGYQAGFAVLLTTMKVPVGVFQSSRPTPTGYVSGALPAPGR